MKSVLNGEARRALRLPRFLYGAWVWVGIASASDILIAILGITSLLMLRPDLVEVMGLSRIPLASRAVTALELNAVPGFLAVLPASMLILSAFKRIVNVCEAPLDPVQVQVMRRAGLHGWVIDFIGDGSYHLYGPNAQREQFGDLADLEWFVDQLEANNGRHVGANLQDDD